MNLNLIVSDKFGKTVDNSSFKSNFVPIFEKISFDFKESFYIPYLSNIKDYEFLFFTIYHGVIYNFIKKLENKTFIDYEEYISIYEHNISINRFNGKTEILYNGLPIVLIYQYQDLNSKTNLDAVKPLFSLNSKIDIISNKKSVANNFVDETYIKNEDIEIIIKNTQAFLKENCNLDFENF